jgi:hypothetical protein
MAEQSTTIMSGLNERQVIGWNRTPGHCLMTSDGRFEHCVVFTRYRMFSSTDLEL